jgi:neurotransmitter:Na+ symporter, NSS family
LDRNGPAFEAQPARSGRCGAGHFRGFLASPLRVGAWHLAFIAIVCTISARGVNRGIELANKIRAPGLLILLLILVAYALTTGDVTRGLTFAFAPDVSKLSANVVLAAIGQAFYATGVGMAMMLAYGAYVPQGASLLRSALVISGSIVLVSLLATLMIFPLVYKYGLNPAQGADLVFNVLPTAFAEMPGGRMIGTLFFLLLVLAAASVWVLGVGSVLSFNAWANWHPFSGITRLRSMTFFDALDFFSSNVLLPVGALFTCALIGWRLPRSFGAAELPEETPAIRRLILLLLRYVCPVAIAAVLVAAFA